MLIVLWQISQKYQDYKFLEEVKKHLELMENNSTKNKSMEGSLNY